jgi:modified peptide precursor CbpA
MTEEKSIIAYRRTCSIDGTGLSHFILMENE